MRVIDLESDAEHDCHLLDTISGPTKKNGNETRQLLNMQTLGL